MTDKERADQLREIANLFYRDQNEQGVEQILKCAEHLAKVPDAARWINPLFDALELGDYILAADILQHELVEKCLVRTERAGQIRDRTEAKE